MNKEAILKHLHDHAEVDRNQMIDNANLIFVDDNGDQSSISKIAAKAFVHNDEAVFFDDVDGDLVISIG